MRSSFQVKIRSRAVAAQHHGRVMASAESNEGPERTPEDEARATVSHGEDDPMLCFSSRSTAAASAPSPMASIPFATRSPWLS